MEQRSRRQSVVYLIGAGASHGCVKFEKGTQGILMRDLNVLLVREVRKLADDGHLDDTLTALANTIASDEKVDFEHIITFLGESPSDAHRSFAKRLREIFERVLRRQLESIRSDVGAMPVKLYSALLDMYRVQGFDEDLKAVLTTNYDQYIENAVDENLWWRRGFRSAGGWGRS